MQPQAALPNVAAVAPTFASQHTATSTQTAPLQQQPQSVSLSAASVATQHASSLLQSSLSQQVSAVPQKQTVVQAAVQPHTLTTAKTSQSSAATQIPPVVSQQGTTTIQHSNITLSTVPVGNEVLVQQYGTVVTNASTQLQYADPNDPKATVI